MDKPIPFPKALHLLAACALKDANRFRLDCVRLASHAGFVRWEATDGRVAVRVDVDVEGAEPGIDILIPADALADAAKAAAKGRPKYYTASLAYRPDGLLYQTMGGPATLNFVAKAGPEARAAFPDFDGIIPGGEPVAEARVNFNVTLLAKAAGAVVALGASDGSPGASLAFYGDRAPCRVTPILPASGVRASGFVMPVGRG